MQWCKRLGENETCYIHFVLFLIFGCCRPIPNNANLQKEKLVFFNRRSWRSLRVMQWWRGWVRTTRVAPLSSRYNSRKA
jgi:hypothetical protein